MGGGGSSAFYAEDNAFELPQCYEILVVFADGLVVSHGDFSGPYVGFREIVLRNFGGEAFPSRFAAVTLAVVIVRTNS